MEFSWSTFLLEVANFLILVWILRRLLYLPVLRIIQERKTSVDRILSDAQEARQQSMKLKEDYDHRLVDWEAEKAHAYAQLREELAAEHARLLDDLHQSIEKEREKARAIDQRQHDELLRALQQDAVRHGGQFATALLKRLASPALEERIVDVVVQDLTTLSADKWKTIERAVRDGEDSVEVSSAFPLDKDRRDGLSRTLQEVLGADLKLSFHEDPTLLAGLRINAGAWVLHGNLADELGFFTRATSGAT